MAMENFALVEWIGDAKPDCWQVVKTSDAFPKVKEFSMGDVLDGIWKEGEETSPAKILKLHGSKPYLQTVKENDYCKPWRNKLPLKRTKSAPRTLQEFLTDGDKPEPEIQENQGQAKESNDTKIKKAKKKAPTSSKKKEKKKTVNIPPSESEDENEPSSKIMKSSKDEAEKVLAAAILQKKRALSPVIPTEDVHRKKQVSPVKATNVHAEEDSEHNEFFEMNKEAETFGLPRIRKNGDQECCRCCKKHALELQDLQQELADLRKSFKRLKRNINELKGGKESSGESNSTTSLENSYREAVKNSTSLFVTINFLMRKIYSKEEIISHSVSGKAANSKLAAKPKFDERLELIKKLAIDVHGIEHATQPKVTAKIQAVQKAVKREMEGKAS